jgi:hypothetical protein
LIITQTNIIRTKFKDEQTIKIKKISGSKIKNTNDIKTISIMSYNIQFAGAADRKLIKGGVIQIK